MLMLGNQVELWESMLAVMKLGAVILPATTALGPKDLGDRLSRGGVRHVITNAEETDKFADVPGDYGRIAVGDAAAPWRLYRDSDAVDSPAPFATTTAPDDPMLVYFTSGTTSGTFGSIRHALVLSTTTQPAFAAMKISSFDGLISTHPPLEERIARLEGRG